MGHYKRKAVRMVEETAKRCGLDVNEMLGKWEENLRSQEAIPLEEFLRSMTKK